MLSDYPIDGVILAAQISLRAIDCPRRQSNADRLPSPIPWPRTILGLHSVGSLVAILNNQFASDLEFHFQHDGSSSQVEFRMETVCDLWPGILHDSLSNTMESESDHRLWKLGLEDRAWNQKARM